MLLPARGKGLKLKAEAELPGAAGAAFWGGVEEVMGLLGDWNGKRMLISAQRAWVAGSCWAWSRK